MSWSGFFKLVGCLVGICLLAPACTSGGAESAQSVTGVDESDAATDVSVDAATAEIVTDASVEAEVDAAGEIPAEHTDTDASVEQQPDAEVEAGFDAGADREVGQADDAGTTVPSSGVDAALDDVEAGAPLWKGRPAPEECLGARPDVEAVEEPVPCRLPNVCSQVRVDCVDDTESCEVHGAIDDAGTQRYFVFHESAVEAVECVFDALISNQPTHFGVLGSIRHDFVDQFDSVAVLGDGTAVLERTLRNDDNRDSFGPTHFRIRSQEWLQQCRELPAGKDKWLCLTNWFEPECLPGLPACPD